MSRIREENDQLINYVMKEMKVAAVIVKNTIF
jgi:hypothetical protein